MKKDNKKVTQKFDYYNRPSLGTSYTIASVCLVCIVVLVGGLALAQLFI